jgi:hypothetical protein
VKRRLKTRVIFQAQPAIPLAQCSADYANPHKRDHQSKQMQELAVAKVVPDNNNNQRILRVRHWEIPINGRGVQNERAALPAESRVSVTGFNGLLTSDRGGLTPAPQFMLSYTAS